MTPEESQTRISMLIMVMIASAANTDYCGFELLKLPDSKKFVRHQVKQWFNELHSVNDKLSGAFLSQFDMASADNLNSLAQDVFDLTIELIKMPSDERRALVEELAHKVDLRLTTAA